MIITYQGNSSFKVSQGELSLAVNPQSKTSADVTLFSSPASDFAKAPPDKAGFIITGPGEYEVKDIFIKGFMDKTFVVTFEGLKLCFLASLAGSDSRANELDDIEDIDILFVPVDSYKRAVAYEPSVIIPMGYDKVSLAQFLKEAGEKDVAPIDKLVVKKKDLDGKEGEIVVLKEE